MFTKKQLANFKSSPTDDKLTQESSKTNELNSLIRSNYWYLIFKLIIINRIDPTVLICQTNYEQAYLKLKLSLNCVFIVFNYNISGRFVIPAFANHRVGG